MSASLRYFKVFSFLILLSITALHGFEWDVYMPTSKAIGDFAFFSTTEGISADLDSIYYTNDEGKTWISSYALTNQVDFYNPIRVMRADSVTGYFITKREGIFKTSDKGKSWVKVREPSSYYALNFANADTGILARSSGLFITYDGGATWIDTSLNYGPGNSTTLFAASTANSKTWSVAGSDVLFVTTDAGTSWDSIPVASIKPDGRRVSQVHFTNSDTGIVHFEYQHSAYKTIDGGQNWVIVNRFPSISGGFFQQVGDTIIYAPDYSGSSFLISYDNGANWTTQSHQSPASDKAFFVNSLVAYKYDLFSRGLYQTRDNWDSFTRLDNGTGGFKRGILFFDTLNGISYGDDRLFLKTTDGGNTWVAKTSPGNGGVHMCAFLDDQIGFCGTNPFGQESGLYRTMNQGESWEPVEKITDNILEVRIWGDDAIFARDLKTFWFSMNKGETWDTLPVRHGGENLRGFEVFSDSVIMAVGTNNLYITMDQGQSWKDTVMSDSTKVYAIDKIDSETAVISGEDGYLVITKDQGKIWNKISTQIDLDLVMVQFIDHNRGFAYGEGGILARTFDGGLSWDSVNVREKYHTDKNLYQSTRDNFRFYIHDENYVWLAGPDESILSYKRYLHASPTTTAPTNDVRISVNAQNTNSLILQYKVDQDGWVTVDSLEKSGVISGDLTWTIPEALRTKTIQLKVVDGIDSTLFQLLEANPKAVGLSQLDLSYRRPLFLGVSRDGMARI